MGVCCLGPAEERNKVGSGWQCFPVFFRPLLKPGTRVCSVKLVNNFDKSFEFWIKSHKDGAELALHTPTSMRQSKCFVLHLLPP